MTPSPFNSKGGILATCILLLVAACEPAVDDPAELEPPVKMRITKYHHVKMVDGVAQADSVKDCFSCNQALVFDESGKEIENRWYKPNMNDLFAKDVYIYGQDGEKLGSEYFAADTLAAIYSYDADSLDASRTSMVRAIHPISKNLLYAYKYGYDDAGNQFETTNYSQHETVDDIYRRTYNENGIVIEENILDPFGEAYFNVKYEYRPRADEHWVEQLTCNFWMLVNLKDWNWKGSGHLSIRQATDPVLLQGQMTDQVSCRVG